PKWWRISSAYSPAARLPATYPALEMQLAGGLRGVGKCVKNKQEVWFSCPGNLQQVWQLNP
ncbi:hypothetical protein ACL1CA_15785, partial [Corynebacterium striatum]